MRKLNRINIRIPSATAVERAQFRRAARKKSIDRRTLNVEQLSFKHSKLGR